MVPDGEMDSQKCTNARCLYSYVPSDKILKSSFLQLNTTDNDIWKGKGYFKSLIPESGLGDWRF